MLKKLFISLLLLAALAAAVFYFGRKILLDWSERPRTLETEVVVEFPRGTSLAELSESLHQAGVIDQPQYFEVWVKFFSAYSRFQAGDYLFQNKIAPQEIAAKIIAGDDFKPVVLEYTIPEGFTYKQVAARLIAKGVGSDAEFQSLKTDEAFLASLEIPATSLEGFLYPATYQFTELPSAKEAIRRAVEIFWKRLPANYKERVEEKGISLADAVNIASLIELETAFDDERSQVSEVIWNRFEAGAALAIDASIIYGIEDYRGNLTKKHLRDRSNPYNSRVHRGLPPTPIGSPSVKSLEAVLTPTNDGWYYYVLDLETGRHQFTKTLKEHNRYVRKLVRETRQRRIEERKNATRKRRAAAAAK